MYKHKTANDIKMLHTWLRTHDFPRGLFRNEFSGLPAFRRNGDIFLALGVAGVDCGGGGASSAIILDVVDAHFGGKIRGGRIYFASTDTHLEGK